MIPSYYEFQNSAKILSGTNALEHIGFELASLGASRPLVLTNRQLIDLKIATIVLDALADTEAEVATVFDDVPVDSSVAVVNEVARVYRETRADAIIAVGGGSVLDTAKGATIVLTQGATDLLQHRGVESLKGRRSVAFIAIPTTAGTGSEVTSAAVIKDTDRHVKLSFQSLSLLPDVAILDPRMTMKLPPRLTASTAMDALTHAVESVSCRQANPLSDCYARAAIDLIREYLPVALERPDDEQARLALANASLMAGVAFSNAMVGIVHAMGHAAGGVAGVAHGEAMGLLLPHGMAYNLDAVGHRYAAILHNLAGPDVYLATPPEDRAHVALEYVRSLPASINHHVELPTRLSEVGVRAEHIPEIARVALDDGALSMNVKQPTLDELVSILEGAL